MIKNNFGDNKNLKSCCEMYALKNIFSISGYRKIRKNLWIQKQKKYLWKKKNIFEKNKENCDAERKKER